VSGAATSPTATGVHLAGTVDPNGHKTAYVFEYGPTLTFGSITVPEYAGAAEDSGVAANAVLSGLTGGTTYYYRLVATNDVGTTFGAVQAFVTSAGPQAPDVLTTIPAVSVTSTTATLGGSVNPRRQQTAYTFEYGPTIAFGSISPVVALDNANVAEPVTATITGLSPNTTYQYRLVATNATGTHVGLVGAFKTAGS
jgi:phosphodiesterase/alkaline phosphatase D-like protein